MSGALRVRALVSDNFALVVGVLVVLVLVGGYLTYATHLASGTAVETREVTAWESTGEFSHRATVVNGTDAFERGTVLRNRSVYFSRITPTLGGSFAYGYAAREGGNLTVDVSTVLVIRSVTETQSGGTTEHWRVERPLENQHVESLSPGETATVPFSTNVTAASQRADRIQQQHGASPGQTRLSLVAHVALTGTRNGEQVDRTRRYTLPIVSQEGFYRVENPGAVTKTGSTTERVTVPASHGAARGIGAPLLLVLSLGLLGGLGLARRRGALSITDREWTSFAYEREREEFDDWITTARVPPVARQHSPIEVDSLEGLVDVAIDTDARVIEDRDRGEYVVLDDGLAYVYCPPRPPEGGESGETDPASISPSSDATNGDQTSHGPTRETPFTNGEVGQIPKDGSSDGDDD